ncbi:MAG: elongation factor P hydroxylase [Kangiellaceae bacterium]|nr:elongation factor P hydroxylase [Kangiellaceae bacterium]
MDYEPNIEALVEVFDQLFLKTENTRLIIGAEEPFYRASINNKPAVIYSRENFYSSALHEIAHWCIAGSRRRTIDDFGYWYEPDGRDEQQQVLFERVEVKPQAIELCLSKAAGHQFNFSADNLSSSVGISKNFKSAVESQAKQYLESSLPIRAQRLFDTLSTMYQNLALLKEFHV